MTSQSGKQKITMRIFPNILRSKANQTMKFGQLTEYNMRNVFLEKSYTKCKGETIPITEKPKYVCFFSSVCFHCISSWGLLQLNYKPITFTSYKAFLKKQKEVWNETPQLIFCMIHKGKYFFCYIFLTDQYHWLVVFISWLYCNCLLTRLWCH